jgi:hypothetical protein
LTRNTVAFSECLLNYEKCLPNWHGAIERERPSCLVAERCCDQVRWALEERVALEGVSVRLLAKGEPDAVHPFPSQHTQSLGPKSPARLSPGLARDYSALTEIIGKWRKRRAQDGEDRSGRPGCPGRLPARSGRLSVPCGRPPAFRSITSPLWFRSAAWNDASIRQL